MKKLFLLLIIPLFTGISAFSQMYILNEDFSGASGTTPPAGWSVNVISGNATDLWHFDNPGLQEVLYPVTEPFAIFDSEHLSANGTPENVALETPLFDASLSNFILLNFHHRFEPGTGGQGKVEAYDGSTWQSIATFTASTLNPESEILDLSAVVGGITNARLRFTWSGNGSGFWALDNIRIYASQPLDGGMVSIDDPTSPVVPGIQNVVVTIGNFGYNTITSATINWSANGVLQPPHTWNGSAGFGQTVPGVAIGSYNFQQPVLLKAWMSVPNGQPDPNPYNDTITKYVQAALCGTYTIGGAGADFATLGEAAVELNAAGITCPVTFLVRDGTYYEQFILRDIPGTSASNTVTFRGESGDSTKAMIRIVAAAQKYEPMIYLDGTRYVNFENIGFMTGSASSNSNSAILAEAAANISFTGCYFEMRNIFDFGITLQSGTRQIAIDGNRFRSYSGRAGAVKITGDATRQVSITGNDIKGASEWGHATLWTDEGAGSIIIEDNTIDSSYQAVFLKLSDSIRVSGNHINLVNDGIRVSDYCSDVEISGNRITRSVSHPSTQDGNDGIGATKSTRLSIFNNFVHTTGDRPTDGISLSEVTESLLAFNSVNVTNTDAQSGSRGVYIYKSSQVTGLNNIFSVKTAGTPVYFQENAAVPDFDKNDHYSFDGTIGNFQGTRYTSLEAWRNATGTDANSISVIPFFSSDTDLSINQALLNNAGAPVAGIGTDIDGTLRNPATPDIGAREYTPCPADAGINAFLSPVNPLSGGSEEVIVVLQNQGTLTLTSAVIRWEVNGQAQPQQAWNGSLPAGAQAIVNLGSYSFPGGELYTIRAWTTQPNGAGDCNPLNDTIFTPRLAAPLCGTYTVGGSDPDFNTLSDVVEVLNSAGVTCPVTILVRDGNYVEQLVFGDMPGTAPDRTVTFRGESGDSTLATVRIRPQAQKFEAMITLEGTRYLRFRDMGFVSGGMTSYNNPVFLLKGARDIGFENCYFETRKQADVGIQAESASRDIQILNNRFHSKDVRAFAVYASDLGTRNITLTGNSIKGATDYTYPTVRLGNFVRNVLISGNSIDSCFRAIQVVDADSIRITGNLITRSTEGVYLDNWCTEIEISGNRMLNMTSHPNANDPSEIISTHNATGVRIFNNYIRSTGNGPAYGISLIQSTNVLAAFNSVNMANSDAQGKSSGFFLDRGTTITSVNNVFSAENFGVPVIIEKPATSYQLASNDYFSPLSKIGYFNGNLYYDLGAWADSTGQDQGSQAVNPFFTSITDLTVNQALLNNAGLPVGGITTDIEGEVRSSSNPDPGAREFSLCSPDAGINAFTSPTSPLSLGPEPVKVILQNQGSSPLTSATLNWKVNETVPAPFSWTGNLGVGQNTEVTVGEYTFVSGVIYRISAWTSAPNGQSDCRHPNDTAFTLPLAAPLCGTYTIGGESPDFVSLEQAATVLNEAGITCPVTMIFRNGTYTEQVSLGRISGSSEVNTVTFRSESLDSSQVLIRISPDAQRFDPVILLDGTSNIRFEHLGLITGTAASNSNPAVMMKGAENITLSNCYFEAKKDSDLGLNIIEASSNIYVENSRISCLNSQASAISVSDEGTRRIFIENNDIRGNAVGGNTLFRFRDGVERVEFTGNRMDKSYRAIYALGVDSLTISGNIIRNTNDGIYVDDQCTVVEISANRITGVSSNQNSPDGTSGIFVRRCTGLDIFNNFIQTQGEGPVIGINLFNNTGIRLIYNSVNVTNTDLQTRSKGIYVTVAEGLYSRNNLLSVKTGGLPIHIDQDVNGISFDYNNYFHPAGTIGKIGDQTYSSLTAWGQTVNGDANAKNVNPYFKADTIPLPYQRALNGAGIPISGILYDVDGKLRFSQAPDIGCLEFFVDYGVLELLSPTLECFHPDVDSVIVYLRQFGDVPFNDLKVAYQLDNGPVHIDTIPGPLIEDVIHAFGTLENITTFGDYRFKIWLINTLDDNINNDTLIAMRYSKPPPVVEMSWDNFCTGWTVNFSGSATVPSPYVIDHYEWLFGDGNIAEEQNPVHRYENAGTYVVRLRAYSDAGCYTEEVREITLDPDFQGLSLDYTLVGETCLGDSTAYLELQPFGGYPPYTVILNEKPVSDTLVTGLTTGQYIVRTVDAQGCTRSDTLDSRPEILMEPAIFATPLSGLTPLTVDFSFTANNPASWLWHFTDTDTSTAAMPTFTFTEYGTHTVILEVQSGHPHYCIETAVIEIFVDIYVSFDANNVFTPNNDGYNDDFGITTTGIDEMTVKIFNVWGNKVFEYDSLDGRWDGTTSGGAEAPDGTYFWYAEALGFDHLTYKRNGSVLLLRHAATAYPNPARDHAGLTVYGTLETPAEISVYSLTGQLVHSETASDREHLEVGLKHLDAGIYLIRVSDGENQYHVRLVKY